MNQVSLGTLIDVFDKAFPILPSISKNDPRTALDQFNQLKIGSIQVISDPLKEWSQGDIVEPLTFIEWSDEGKPYSIEAPGMIITNTCDLDRKDNIVFCPCFPLSKLGDKKIVEDISQNIVFEFFYIDKALDGSEWAVDLSRPMALPRKRVFEKLELNTIVRKHSLTSRGWYLFITKFSMKYFRPDDSETMESRHI